MKNKKSGVRWPVVLRTRRLEIRPYRDTDKDYQAWRAAWLSRKPKQNEFDSETPDSKLFTRAKFRKNLRRWQSASNADRGYLWAIFQRRTGEVLGIFDVYIYDRGVTQAANFGYLLHNRHWRQGYGKEAGRAVARSAFRDLGLQRLDASIAPKNRASMALARALGFRRLGLRRKSDFLDGEWRDEVVYCATPDDFGLPVRPPRVQRP